MKPITTALLLGLALNCAHAQDDLDWYEVELLVFKYLDAPAIASEHWPTTAGAPDWHGTRHFIDGPAVTAQKQPNAYALLPNNVQQLNSVRDTLERKSGYAPMLHMAWRQIVPTRKQPDRIYLSSDANATPAASRTVAPSSATVNMDTFSQNTFSNHWNPAEAVAEVEGVFTVSRGRYLHVNLDLVWTPREQDLIPAMSAMAQPATPFQTALSGFDVDTLGDPNEAAPRQFRIQANRRMRSGEIHYLDHPMLSALVLFTPYTPPEPEVSDAEILPITTPITPSSNP